jgi:hypothetical protein
MKHALNLSSPLIQRLVLAFTTGLFLACSARMSMI